MIDAVLFEFDGVIADTRAPRQRALLETLEGEGITLTSTEYVERCAAQPVRSAIRAALTLRRISRDETGIELAALRTERRFASLVETGLSLVDGARSTIEALQGQTRLGIVSRASRSEIDRTLTLARLDHAFEFILADDDAAAPKPSPEPYLHALERLSRRRAVVPRNVVALEDGPVGIRAARDAGLRCAVIGSIPVHLAVDADALIPSLVGLTIRGLDGVTLGTHVAGR